jgi:hypothetical protein
MYCISFQPGVGTLHPRGPELQILSENPSC